VEPIYPAAKPAAKPSAASGGERQEKVPEPAAPQGWFYRAPDSEEPAGRSSADEKPRAAAEEQTRAAADRAKPASEPAAGAATGSAAQARTAGSGASGTATAPTGTGEAGDKSRRGKQGSADAGAAGSGDRPVAASPRNGDGPPPDREVTIVPGVPRYHRPGCSTIRFMDEGDLEKRTLKSAEEAGCAPCEACQAGAPDPADQRSS
jgi:hypothetical protein